jgi:hypothetical protein
MLFIAIYCSFISIMVIFNSEDRRFYIKSKEKVNLEGSIERTCFLCNQELNVYDFYKTNRKFSKDEIIKLWNNENIQYFCCRCYNRYKDDFEMYLNLE